MADAASTTLDTAFGFETSGQGMAAVGSVRAPVELFHADEATLQSGPEWSMVLPSSAR